jgi:hypothetical protein
MGLLEGDGGVDSGGVALEGVKLVGWEGDDGTVGSGTELEGSLEAVVGEEGWAEDFGEGAGCVTAEGVQLPEAVLRGDEALGDEEVVEGGGADVGDAVGVAQDGDGCRESRNGDGAVELGEGVGKGLAEPMAGGDEADDGDDEDEGGDDEEDAADEQATAGFFWGEGLVGDYFCVGEMGEAHGFIASVNGRLRMLGGLDGFERELTRG